MTKNLNHLFLLSTCLVLTFAAASLFKVQAHQLNETLSCQISLYQTSANSLPVGSQRSLVAADQTLTPGTNYLYTFNLTSPVMEVDHINSIDITPMSGAAEPLNILQVRSPSGPCAISSEKRMKCTTSYQFFEEATEPLELLVSPFFSASQSTTSFNFYVQTDHGTANCTSYHQIIAPASPTPAPQLLPAVQNLRVKGYRSVIDSDYKEAILEWDAVPGAMRYEIMSIGSTANSIGGTENTQYTIRFRPSSTWYVAIYAQDWHWNRGQLSDQITVEYPGNDSLPPVPNFYSTPSPSPLPTPSSSPWPSSSPSPRPSASPSPSSSPRPRTATPTPMASPVPFDSSEIAILEQRLEDLEQKQRSQEKRLGILETIVAKIKTFFAQFWR